METIMSLESMAEEYRSNKLSELNEDLIKAQKKLKQFKETEEIQAANIEKMVPEDCWPIASEPLTSGWRDLWREYTRLIDLEKIDLYYRSKEAKLRIEKDLELYSEKYGISKEDLKYKWPNGYILSNALEKEINFIHKVFNKRLTRKRSEELCNLPIIKQKLLTAAKARYRERLKSERLGLEFKVHQISEEISAWEDMSHAEIIISFDYEKIAPFVKNHIVECDDGTILITGSYRYLISEDMKMSQLAYRILDNSYEYEGYDLEGAIERLNNYNIIKVVSSEGDDDNWKIAFEDGSVVQQEYYNGLLPYYSLDYEPDED